MLTPFLAGLGTEAGLIIAIGSQNTFVLSQGIRRQHHITVALICSLCDAILIIAGTAGLGRIIQNIPIMITIASLSGALFLCIYGLMSLISAIKGTDGIKENGGKVRTKRDVVLAALTITLLNPHVYLETVVLLGGISSAYGDPGRYVFGFGALTMSFIWFFGISIGAGFLSPLFRKPVTWRVLNIVIFLIMWSIAYKLFLYSDILNHIQTIR